MSHCECPFRTARDQVDQDLRRSGSGLMRDAEPSQSVSLSGQGTHRVLILFTDRQNSYYKLKFSLPLACCQLPLSRQRAGPQKNGSRPVGNCRKSRNRGQAISGDACVAAPTPRDRSPETFPFSPGIVDGACGRGTRENVPILLFSFKSAMYRREGDNLPTFPGTGSRDAGELPVSGRRVRGGGYGAAVTRKKTGSG